MEGSLQIPTFDHLPSSLDFSSVESRNVPAVFIGCVKNWRAFSNWNPSNGGLDYLQERVGSSTVEAMLSRYAPIFYGDIRSHERVPLPFSAFIGFCKQRLQDNDVGGACFESEGHGLVGSDAEQSSSLLGEVPQQIYLAQVPIMNAENDDRVQLETLKEDIQTVQRIYACSPGVAQRIHFCYGVYLPTIHALRKEYGELLVSCGLIGEAIKIFEQIELWNNLIDCYCLLGKKAAAVELIKARLSEMPSDPRLWCSLGDVTNDDACYEKALEVSNNRSARAKRSLARSAYNRGDYEMSKTLWESAMALNSLYPGGWFALGAAALKARDIEKALDGFTRAVQLDPENGEAWNNIACLHMIKKKSKESFIAFKEALKFKRDSWQLWENYSQVAADIGNIRQALEATLMVLELTNNKRIDSELLERITLEMEKRTSTRQPVSSDKKTRQPVSSEGATNDSCTGSAHPSDPNVIHVGDSTSSESGMGISRENENLVEVLGKVLQKIVRSGGGADIWGLYARWLKLKGDLTMCSEALLKQVRSYQGSDMWKDRDRFKKFADASVELCNVYMEISSSTGSRRELLAAEMHLRNIVKQGESFSETEEFKDVEACLVEVKMKLESNLERAPPVVMK